jgi:hypothetical protein
MIDIKEIEDWFSALNKKQKKEAIPEFLGLISNHNFNSSLINFDLLMLINNENCLGYGFRDQFVNYVIKQNIINENNIYKLFKKNEFTRDLVNYFLFEKLINKSLDIENIKSILNISDTDFILYITSRFKYIDEIKNISIVDKSKIDFKQIFKTPNVYRKSMEAIFKTSGVTKNDYKDFLEYTDQLIQRRIINYFEPFNDIFRFVDFYKSFKIKNRKRLFLLQSLEHIHLFSLSEIEYIIEECKLKNSILHEYASCVYEFDLEKDNWFIEKFNIEKQQVKCLKKSSKKDYTIQLQIPIGQAKDLIDILSI